MHAGKEGGGGAGMIAGTIAQRAPGVVSQPGEHHQVLAVGLERLENARKFKLAARNRGGPVLHDDAVGHIDECHAARCVRGEASRGGESRRHRIQQRQSNGGAHAAQEGAARKVLPGDHGFPPEKAIVCCGVRPGASPWRISKGTLWTIPSTSWENR